MERKEDPLALPRCCASLLHGPDRWGEVYRGGDSGLEGRASHHTRRAAALLGAGDHDGADLAFHLPLGAAPAVARCSGSAGNPHDRSQAISSFLHRRQSREDVAHLRRGCIRVGFHDNHKLKFR